MLCCTGGLSPVRGREAPCTPVPSIRGSSDPSRLGSLNLTRVGHIDVASGKDPWLYNGGEFNIPMPAGTFLEPGPSYNSGHIGTLAYGIAFNLLREPEPST
jgi:hypothetical protein